MDSDPTTSRDASQSPGFEESLARLDEIARALEDNRLGLTQSLGIYEEGVGLLKSCQALLQQAERKIELLTGIDADGKPIVKPFDDAATFAHQTAVSTDAGLVKKRKRAPTKSTAEETSTPSTKSTTVTDSAEPAPWEDGPQRLF